MRRGPGELFGTRQSGKGGLSPLCLQELSRSPPLMEAARAAAASTLAARQVTPKLKAALVAYGYWKVTTEPTGESGSSNASGTGVNGDGDGAKGMGRSGVTGA